MARVSMSGISGLFDHTACLSVPSGQSKSVYSFAEEGNYSPDCAGLSLKSTLRGLEFKSMIGRWTHALFESHSCAGS